MPSSEWTLDPEVVYLNHGSFGACPRSVLERQAELRARLERDPVRFFDRDLRDLYAQARAGLGDFVGAAPDDIAFVNNATTGVNAVLRSLELSAGDELLTTDHEYAACRNALDFVADRAGAQVVVAKIPFPVQSRQQIVDAVLERVTERTRLALIDHVTSQTAVVMPIAEISIGLAERGVDLLVDGAHAPGMLDLNIEALGAAYYAGNCHKWLCAPKGAAFLWVRQDRQAAVRPAVISHGANVPVPHRFRVEFDWVGTDDPSAALCVPAAIEAIGAMVDGGWPRVRERNRAVALVARDIVCERLSVPPPVPDDMLGSMASIPLPDSDALPADHGAQEPLQAALYDRCRIQIPVHPWPARPERLIRLSAQLYNDVGQFELLAEKLDELLSEG